VRLSVRSSWWLIVTCGLTAIACRQPEPRPELRATAPVATSAPREITSAAQPGEIASGAPSPPMASAAATQEQDAGPAPPLEPPVRLGFVGDVNMSLMIGHYIERLAQGQEVPRGVKPGFPFNAVRARLAAADLTIGNMECVVSRLGKRNTKYNPFRASKRVIPLLREAGFDMMSVANNHALDWGPTALADMIENLDTGNLPAIGRNAFGETPQAPVVREVRGLRLGFLGYYDNKVRPEKAYADVRRARAEADVIIVFNHWGWENQVELEPGQREFGNGLVDAGADLVVGTHAHVLQPEEWYRGKLIFHGLGNFVFTGMSYDEIHRTGGYLEVDMDRTGVRARRFWRSRLDEHGAPHWLDKEPITPEQIPPRDTPGSAP
jgi:poly-gamma-glutamate synthesis protein (capsule biosynthesis protein)